MRSRIARKLAISAASLVLVVGGAEVLCRAAGLAPKADEFRWRGDPYTGFSPLPDQDTFLLGGPDAESGRIRIPVHINQHGLRGEDFDLAPAEGERRIAVLGDSLTMGQGVGDDEAYPQQLNQILVKRWPELSGTRVLNAGVNGWTCWHYAQWAKHRLPPFGADLLVVGLYLGNDFELPPQGAGTIPVPLENVLRDSALYHGLKRLYRNVLWKRVEAQRRNVPLSEIEARLEELAGKKPSSLSEHEQRLLWRENAIPQLLRVRDTTNAQGVDLIVLLIPTLDLAAAGPVGIHEYMRGELERQGVSVATCIDELRAMGREAWLSWDSGHLSVEGNLAVARALARQLGSP